MCVGGLLFLPLFPGILELPPNPRSAQKEVQGQYNLLVDGLEDKAPASSPRHFARVVPVPGVAPLPLHLATPLLLLHPAQVPAFSGNLP